jgi:hypothetical protein
MKKIVLTFGLLSGAVASVMMVGTMLMLDRHRLGFDNALFVGYTAIVLSLLFIFFGIRSYRENVGGGTISFGKAFAVGILITLISTVFYVVTWEILYFNFLPDFVEKWTAYAVEELRASGAGQAAVDAKIEEMKGMKAILDNPLLNAAFTFIEPFPVGLLITLISAAILKKKGPKVALPSDGQISASA